MPFSYDAETYRGLTGPVPSNSTCPIQWPLFVEEVKMLYYKHSYKRCVYICEMMLQGESQMVT